MFVHEGYYGWQREFWKVVDIQEGVKTITTGGSST